MKTKYKTTLEHINFYTESLFTACGGPDVNEQIDKYYSLHRFLNPLSMVSSKKLGQTKPLPSRCSCIRDVHLAVSDQTSKRL